MHQESQSDTVPSEDRSDDTGPVVLVSTIVPQDGRTLELLYGEVAAMHFGGEDDCTGPATRLYLSLCGQAVMLEQAFDSMQHYHEWGISRNGRLALERLRSMAERMDQSFYRLFYRD